ncbi:MAG: DUF4215 domain-containing protein [Myxococcota bacterium]
MNSTLHRIFNALSPSLAASLGIVVVAGGCSTGEALTDQVDTLAPGLADGGASGGGDAGPADPGGEPDCEIGTLGCWCMLDADCDAGLVCDQGICLPVEGICGDGVVDEAEECDAGPDNAEDGACRPDCTAQLCGDGVVGPGEACDDGNDVDDDECNNLCGGSSCGNGVLDEGEECDDSNLDDSDECLSSCLAATCGDGFVQAGVEECDDADEDEADGCAADCVCWLDFEDDAQVVDWQLEGGWELHDAAPASQVLAAVPFETQGRVFGTDGNRSLPYPGGESESSSATTSDFVFPTSLRFRSWHVDEGTVTAVGVADHKRILVSVDVGATWEPLVDCQLGPNEQLPFCLEWLASREADDWDDVEIDTSAYAGMMGRLRFEYDTVDSCCTVEQGWFLDDFEAFGCS